MENKCLVCSLSSYDVKHFHSLTGS